MNEEGRKKETENNLAIENLLKGFQRPAPIDVGDGWIKVALPPHPMFADASSYQKTTTDLFGFLICMIQRRKKMDDPAIFPDGRWHLSISHNYRNPNIAKRLETNIPGRYPTWDEIKEARYKFLPDNVNMAIMFPPQEMYYNRHPTCLHLIEIPISMAIDPNQKGGL